MGKVLVAATAALLADSRRRLDAAVKLIADGRTDAAKARAAAG